jgi:subtilase family serine protease
VDDPGSQAYVLSVGGTTADAHAEVVWNSGSSAGGGGVSTVHCMPAYQHNVSVPNLFNSGSVVDASCVSGYDRQVPDVTAMADPNTGYTIYYDSGLTAIGGTSGAAPLWAGAAALILASPYCSYDHASVGVSPQSLYALAATPMYGHGLRDITAGNNAVQGGTLYTAAVGYDEASGLGSPTLTLPSRSLAVGLFQPGLASLLCYAQGSVVAAPVVTAVAPNVAASTAPTTITVTGTGFLPITGAVRVTLGGRSFAASCVTSTHCTVVLNRLAPGTSDLRVYDQTYAESPATSADLVTILPPPTLRSLTPNKGSNKGRTRVTIRGTGFTGTVSVRFGTRAATHVTVVSPTEVVVSAPAGTGTVYVTVTASGGVSVRRPVGLYHY